jgi:hypothetical protein
MTAKWIAWRTTGKKVKRPTVSFTGTWKNDLGSQMRLAVKKGRVTGTYETHVGAPKTGEKFPITGFVNGDLIAFVVSWNKYGSMTSWVGQHTIDPNGANERIETSWHLVKNVEEAVEGPNLWGSCLTGHNTFRR